MKSNNCDSIRSETETWYRLLSSLVSISVILYCNITDVKNCFSTHINPADLVAVRLNLRNIFICISYSSCFIFQADKMSALAPS